ncbi:MAG: polysaccharide deacetylase family protein [Candidatus Competibacter sp.]|nr:polysaccharide deacetylase family protein [Candidatus Competibacter sp.]
MGLKNRLFGYYFPEFLVTQGICRIPPFSGIVLMYHEILPDEVKIPAWTVVKETDFRWQMCYLQAHFDVVSMDEALKRVYGMHDFNKPFAVITFDDGYKGNLDIVLPIMESMGLPFILYVATQAIIENNLYWYDQIISLLNYHKNIRITLTTDNRIEYFNIPYNVGEKRRWQATQRLLTRLKQMFPDDRDRAVNLIVNEIDEDSKLLKMLTLEDLVYMAKSDCVTIGSHTHGHELLDQLAPQNIQQTLQTASLHISRIIGYSPKHFAYPNGNFNECVIDEIQQAGLETAVTTVPGMWSEKNFRFKIPRIGIGRFETKERFKAKIFGYL